MYELVGGFLFELLSDPELGPRYREADTVVQYRLSEPDGVITMALLAGEPPRVDCGVTDLEPEVIFSMTAATLHRYWLGGVDATHALARGYVKATGPVMEILRNAPLNERGFARYAARVAAAELPGLG